MICQKLLLTNSLMGMGKRIERENQVESENSNKLTSILDNL